MALALAALVSASAVCWISSHGYTLYYGDSEAHLNIARRVLDSRTPGPFQIGSVWLPMPHLLMLPFVWSDTLWRTGLAGAFSSAVCFIAAGMFLFASARRVFGGRAAAAATLSLFVLNPNALYLQATPMTEPVLFGTLAALVYATVRFRESQSLVWVALAGVAGIATSLARYEGWALIPVVSLFFLIASRKRRLLAGLLFAVIASLGPLAWLAHNWWYWGDFLEFYRGPHSAHAIWTHTLATTSMTRYRGDHNWQEALLYYRHAVWLAAGGPVVWMGVIGLVAGFFKRAFWPILLLAAPALFIVASMHSGGTPIFMPHLWPFSYYNTRFGVTALPALAFAAGALVAVMPARLRVPAWLAVVALAVVPWLRSPWPQSSICWKESQVNSDARRNWTSQAGRFLSEHYRPGTGIVMTFGDLPGILRAGGIPLRESLHDDNVPAWPAAMARPALFLFEEWALAIRGDPVDQAIARASREGLRYRRVKTISVKGAEDLYIYRRN
ncbi:MAG TPA: glycosyltransferase family 39 protein [Bryobacteraceae bacterium]|nr:glycosyltransferase family 39 protein [Bryobacteraceae bacterium]